jgi:fructose-bisphosphate aldolase class II
MPVVSLPEVMTPAFKKRYGVAAFNTVDDVTMSGAIKAAEASRSPLIIQTSVKTVKFWGAQVVKDMFADMAGKASVPVTLHLDHCPEPDFAKECIKVGWNSVLFDGSKMNYKENFRITKEIAAFAKPYGASVEGEIVPVAGVEDGVGQEMEGDPAPLEDELEFIRESGIYCYAPAIGTAHGFYKAAPTIKYDRMTQLVEATQMPMVLHGGTGLTDEIYKKLISLGAAKVNISTALKKAYADSFTNYIGAHPTEYEPMKLLGAVQKDVIALVQSYLKKFGSENQV